MPRYKEPPGIWVTPWGIAPCCHTCLHYGDDGKCMKWQTEPPEEFAATPGQCDDYGLLIPF